MNTVDTNILVRAFLKDDPDQSPKAQKLLEKLTASDGIFVSCFTLIELSWILRTKKKTRIETYETIRNLMETDGVTVGNPAIVFAALEFFKTLKIGFEDCLILAESLTSGSSKLHTFDKEFSKSHEHCKAVM